MIITLINLLILLIHFLLNFYISYHSPGGWGLGIGRAINLLFNLFLLAILLIIILVFLKKYKLDMRWRLLNVGMILFYGFFFSTGLLFNNPFVYYLGYLFGYAH